MIFWAVIIWLATLVFLVVFFFSLAGSSLKIIKEMHSKRDEEMRNHIHQFAVDIMHTIKNK